jgi:hypothetical protein
MVSPDQQSSRSRSATGRPPRRSPSGPLEGHDADRIEPVVDVDVTVRRGHGVIRLSTRVHHPDTVGNQRVPRARVARRRFTHAALTR